MEDNAVNMEYGCVFCRTGKETALAETLQTHLPGVEAFVPSKLRLRRHGGTADEEKVILFPGYVFFRAPADFPITKMNAYSETYFVLRSDEDHWQLYGADRDLAEQIYRSGGVVGFSKAWYEGDRIRIAEGFLKNHEGHIIRVNNRARTAQIQLDFVGRQTTLWLGFELIDPPDET